jgi:hypothetical protein
MIYFLPIAGIKLTTEVAQRISNVLVLIGGGNGVIHFNLSKQELVRVQGTIDP